MNPIEEKLIIKYLMRHYPIVRIKDNKHFKRGIELIRRVNGFTEKNKILLRDPQNKIILVKEISEDISIVFGISPDKIKIVVNNYINRY